MLKITIFGNFSLVKARNGSLFFPCTHPPPPFAFSLKGVQVGRKRSWHWSKWLLIYNHNYLNFCTIFKKFWVSSTMCQDAILHEQYFDKEIKGKLILSKNSCTSNQSEPEVNSWVVLCRILSFFGQVSLLRLQLWLLSYSAIHLVET